jgi:cell wall-associated NlpC family hydrolase
MGDEAFMMMWAEIQKHLGKPYVYGGSGPNVFDCSGFVSFVLNNSGLGINVGRQTATGLYNLSDRVSASELRPGDLVFFQGTYSTPRPVSHVGIYIGDGRMAHAGRPVNVTSIHTPFWIRHFHSFGRIST